MSNTPNQANDKKASEKKAVGIVLGGINQAGKTTLAKAFCGIEYDKDYEQTNDEKEYETQLAIGGIPYNFFFVDANGNAFEETKGTTAATTLFGKGKVHIYVVNKEDEGSADCIAGYFKAFGAENIEVFYKLIIVTHKNSQEADPKIIERIKSFSEKTPIWEVDLSDPKEVEELKTKLCEFLKRAKGEHPELFNGCEAKKGKKDKSNKQAGQSGKKSRCVIC